MIRREVDRLRQLGYSLIINAIEMLVREGFHPTLGARPLRNTVDRVLQERVAIAIMESSLVE